MTRAILADTGPLYASIDRDDQYHPRARQELNVIARQEIGVLVAWTTALECHALLLQRLGAATAHRWLNEVQTGASLITPTGSDLDEAATLVKGYPDQRITLFDAVAAVLAGRLALPVWTFDHHFDVMRVPVWR